MVSDKIYFRVTHDEKKAVQRMAAAAEMNVSDFVRRRIFSERGSNEGSTGERAALAQQIDEMQANLAGLLQKLIAFERFTGSIAATHYADEHPDGLEIVRNFQREFGITEGNEDHE